MPLTSFSASQVISSSAVNANFALCVLTDTARTITVTHTFTPTQTFTGGFTTAAAVTLGGNLLFTDATYDIGAAGATRPRDLFLSRNAVVGGTLGVTGAATLSSTLNVTGTTTLGSANMGAVTLASITQASATAPATGILRVANNNVALSTRNAADSADLWLYTNASDVLRYETSAGVAAAVSVGAVTCATVSCTTVTASGLVSANAGLTVASGQTLTLTGVTVTGLNLGAATATSLSLGGATLLDILTATVVHDFGSIAAAAHSSTTVAVAGAAVGDIVIVGGGSVVLGNYSLMGYVSATDTVTIVFQNNDDASIDPASATYRVVVFQF